MLVYCGILDVVNFALEMEKTMIDFSNAKEELNTYKGSGKKKTLIYDNKRYWVKFPDPITEKNKNISCISNVRKVFYKKIINYRYEILKNVYNRLEEIRWK